MSYDEAKKLCEHLAREHPDRGSHLWITSRDKDREWSVVKVAKPEGLRIDPLKPTVEAKPRPPQPDDPRPAIFRNIPPWGA